MKKTTVTMALLALAACSPTMDMHGEDPRDFYAEHPIKNTIEDRSKSVKLDYAPEQSRLSPSEIDKLQDSLHTISMLSVDAIQVNFSPSDKNNGDRKMHLLKLLRNMGYDKDAYTFKTLSTLKSGEVQLDFTYSVVVSPNCPDWRTSPVTTFSNTSQGNFRCAQEVNTGLMVADPHDIVRGTGDVAMDPVNADRAVEDYHESKGPTPGGGATPTPASGGTNSSPPSSSSSGSSSSGGGNVTAPSP